MAVKGPIDMKTATKFFLAGILVLGAVLLASEIDRSLYIYPTPETQSDFLKTYSPAPAIDRFKRTGSSSKSSSGGSSAGRKFATHRRDEQQYFVIAAESAPLLADAVKDDISERLAKQGARITEKTNSAAGFEVRYELGKTRGVVAFDPLQTEDPTTVVGRAGLQPGNVAVMLRVRIAETWSRAQSGSRSDWPMLRNP